MNQKDSNIIERSNLNNQNVIVINQCCMEVNDIICLNKYHKMINTNTRGLSISRNIGIMNSSKDICVLSDDDEIFVDNVKDIILKAYSEQPDADLIAFNLIQHECKLNKKSKLNIKTIFNICSCQITFKRKAIIDNKICFDKNIGSGTENGAGEENKFLLECYRAGLKMYYFPYYIATIEESESKWFKGYDKEYFFKDGRTNRYIMGWPMSIVYGLYFVIFKYYLYCNKVSIVSAFWCYLKGTFYKINR